MTRKSSHIMTIETSDNEEATVTKETVIESLITQRDRLVELKRQIEADLKSLGYDVDEHDS